MKEKTIQRFTTFFLALTLCTITFQDRSFAEVQKNFLWKVQSSSGTVYLLGSLHFLKREAYPLHRIIEDAFASSRTLVVEANINDLSQLDLGKLMSTAIYQNGDSIERHLSRQTYAALQKRLQQNGMASQLIERQKPWLAALTITALELSKMGFDPNYGIDKYFLTKAAGRKTVLELESIDYQIDLLSGFSEAEQDLFLMYTLRDLDLIRAEADNLVRVWKTGDVRGLESLLSKSATNDGGMSSIYEKLFFVRNAEMTRKIEGYLRTGETAFVVVGAGHLVGEKGIVQALRRKGYTVEQL
jgi:hypothetical protein